MKQLNNGESIISKKVINSALINTSYEKLELKSYDDNNYLLSTKEIEKLKNKLSQQIRLFDLEKVKRNKKIDSTRLISLLEKYEQYNYKYIQNKYDKNKRGINLEDVLDAQNNVFEEYNKINKIPNLINSVDKLINEISNDSSKGNLSLKDLFNDLKKDGGFFEDYQNIENNVLRKIKYEYIHNITKLMDINPNNELYLIVKDEENGTKLMSKENLKDFSYGYIYAPEDIICAKNNKDKEEFISFNNLDKKKNIVEINDKSPIGIYAITLGEKNLSENYKNAVELKNNYPLIPLLEFDLSKYLKDENLLDIKENFINKMLDDKGIVLSNIDSKNNFSYFFKLYDELKNGRYTEERIINLFDYTFNIIYSQTNMDLTMVLDKYKTVEDVKEILENNVYFKGNIFRNRNQKEFKKLTKEDLRMFYDVFEKVRNNEIINIIYPGLSVIINYLDEINTIDLLDLVKLINNSKTVDSWYISQNIKPTHMKIKTEKEELIETKQYYKEIKNEMDFKEFLKQNDEAEMIAESSTRAA